ncbi:hypothetical protein CTAYLR_002985 [Chrysophaeum taylorii]|uniref:RRM domain-containing protein n=1 Tax=Chrysophaeum taylorii TaxID=2483200 RepID=A0AAD7U776_9STRA|nr:hypothetical protein CTAYLR_002985 [Chrysophaeum taylorii]
MQVRALNERELQLGISGSASWHEKYADSAWVYVGGLPRELSEGDVICVLSQWGELEDFNMPRDRKTGTPRGWCWCKYVDQRSTILAVDNMAGVKLLGRTLRVDHCERYKLPEELKEAENKFEPGALYKGKDLASEHTLEKGVDVWASKKEKKKKKDKKKRKRDNDDGLLPMPDEPVPAPTELPLLSHGEEPLREGEILAPSWRGNREPNAPTLIRKIEDKPPALSWEELEKERNRSYGGMSRAR